MFLYNKSLKKKRRYIDKVNEKLKQIGWTYITDKNYLKQINEEAFDTFSSQMAS